MLKLLIYLVYVTQIRRTAETAADLACQIKTGSPTSSATVIHSSNNIPRAYGLLLRGMFSFVHTSGDIIFLL